MATPLPNDVATFIRITGAPEFVAVQKLEEYGGNLNEAVNAYFMEGDRNIQRQNSVAAPQHNYTDANNQNRAGSGGILPFLSAARSFRPSRLLDPNYRRELRGMVSGIGAIPFSGPVRADSHPGEAREVPSMLSSTNADRISDGRGVYGTDDHQNDYNLAQSRTSNVPDNEIEEAMIQAALEASKKEIREGSSGREFAALNDSSDGRLPQSHFQQEDDDLAHALSMSLKTAEQEEAIREHLLKQKMEGLGLRDLLARGEKTNSGRSILEWDGISYDELNEAVLLESALYGESSSHSSHKISSLPDPQHHPEKAVEPKIQSLSSTTSQLSTDTQFPRQQQELEKMLDKKEIRLSNEPPADDENAITIVVRMPDGSRQERRFLKTDKLQLLFDFIDHCGAVEPGNYRVVKSYPRRAYSTDDSSSTLNEVGLSSKNEALFLELS